VGNALHDRGIEMSRTALRAWLGLTALLVFLLVPQTAVAGCAQVSQYSTFTGWARVTGDPLPCRVTYQGITPIAYPDAWASTGLRSYPWSYEPRRHGEWVWVAPYATGWSWTFTQATGWRAMRDRDLVVRWTDTD